MKPYEIQEREDSSMRPMNVIPILQQDRTNAKESSVIEEKTQRTNVYSGSRERMDMFLSGCVLEAVKVVRETCCWKMANYMAA